MQDKYNLIREISIVRSFKGYDTLGRATLLFLFSKKPRFEMKTTKITSRVSKVNENYGLFISLIDDDKNAEEIFEVFINDIITAVKIASSEIEVLRILSGRFQYWSELFSKKIERLNANWIQGIVGELFFIEKVLTEKIGIDSAISSWIGPKKTSQDFVFNDITFEVKTKLENSKTITISNENQLNKDMYLSVIDIEKTSAESKEGINLYGLLKVVNSKITNPKALNLFNINLIELGLFPIDESKIYDSQFFQFKNVTHYYVNDKFPVIKHSEVPDAITSYKFVIDLIKIDSYMVKDEDIWTY